MTLTGHSGKPAVTQAGVGDAATVFFYQRIDEFSAVRPESAQRAFLVLADKAGITRYVCSDDGCEPTPVWLLPEPV